MSNACGFIPRFPASPLPRFPADRRHFMHLRYMYHIAGQWLSNKFVNIIDICG
jgi:hypothetical protein